MMPKSSAVERIILPHKAQTRFPPLFSAGFFVAGGLRPLFFAFNAIKDESQWHHAADLRSFERTAQLALSRWLRPRSGIPITQSIMIKVSLGMLIVRT